jgi:hypothetical protein
MTESEKNIIFPVSPLHIKLSTNLSKNESKDVKDESKDLIKTENDKSILFKRSMLKMPKMNIAPVLTSEFPFFTRNVRYPESIQNLEWGKRYEFFFNKDLFVSKLKQEAIDNPTSFLRSVKNDKDQEWIIKTEKHNIMVTLRALFPIPETFGKALDNSYDMLMNKTNARILKDVNIRSAMNIFGFMYKFGIASKEMEDYFVNIDGKRYMVDNIIWENDLLNHPIYRSFLKSQRETYEKVENSTSDVKDKYDVTIEKLNADLQNMLDIQNLQSDFFYYSDRETESMLEMIIGLKKSDTDINKYIEDASGNILPNVKYLIHKHYFKKKYNDEKKIAVDDYDKKKDIDQILIHEFIEYYEKMNELGLDGLRSKHDFYPHIDKINDYWDIEMHNIHQLENIEKTDVEVSQEKFEIKLKEKLISDLKTDTIQILRENIISKNETSYSSFASTPRPEMSPRYSSTSPAYPYSTNIERKSTVRLVSDKLKKLSKETGENAANTIISIKDDFDSYLKSRQNEDINVFMDREYTIIFERLLKLAIEIKGTKIVLNFAQKNIPMNLSDKNPDGSDILPLNKRINKFITEYFRDISTINDELVKSLNYIYEPKRKTSNVDLYKVLRLFKLGDVIMQTEYKATSSELDEYKKVFQTIYDKYISIIGSNSSSNAIDISKYMYTGVDEVNEESSQRNVQQIYVYIDLVEADAYEKTPNAACKLLDKELEQEFKYLSDPRNKNNYMLKRFRDYEFTSNETKPTTNTNTNPNNTEIKKPTNTGGGGGKTKRRNIQKRKFTIRRR